MRRGDRRPMVHSGPSRMRATVQQVQFFGTEKILIKICIFKKWDPTTIKFSVNRFAQSHTPEWDRWKRKLILGGFTNVLNQISWFINRILKWWFLMQLVVRLTKKFLILFNLSVPFTSKENFPATRTRFYYPSPTVPNRKFSRWRNSPSDASFIGLICNLGAFGRNLPPGSCHTEGQPLQSGVGGRSVGRNWTKTNFQMKLANFTATLPPCITAGCRPVSLLPFSSSSVHSRHLRGLFGA